MRFLKSSFQKALRRPALLKSLRRPALLKSLRRPALLKSLRRLELLKSLRRPARAARLAGLAGVAVAGGLLLPAAANAEFCPCFNGPRVYTNCQASPVPNTKLVVTHYVTKHGRGFECVRMLNGEKIVGARYGIGGRPGNLHLSTTLIVSGRYVLPIPCALRGSFGAMFTVKACEKEMGETRSRLEKLVK